MWSAIRWLVLRIAAIRWLFKLGWLGTAHSRSCCCSRRSGCRCSAFCSIVAIPLLILLFLFGLPIILVRRVRRVVHGRSQHRPHARPRGAQDRPVRRAAHLVDVRRRAAASTAGCSSGRQRRTVNRSRAPRRVPHRHRRKRLRPRVVQAVRRSPVHPSHVVLRSCHMFAPHPRALLRSAVAGAAHPGRDRPRRRSVCRSIAVLCVLARAGAAGALPHRTAVPDSSSPTVIGLSARCSAS